MPQLIGGTRVELAVTFGAVASWFFVSWLVLLLLSASRSPGVAGMSHPRSFVVGGLVLGLSLWGAAVVAAWPVRCPICHERLLMTNGSAPRNGTLRAQSSYWNSLLEQFWPARVLMDGRCNCLHCGAEIQLQGQ
jgi:hypothetical protein